MHSYTKWYMLKKIILKLNFILYEVKTSYLTCQIIKKISTSWRKINEIWL